MIPWLDWKTWCGSLAVIGAALLLSPGVQVVEASDEVNLAYLRALRSGPTCENSGIAPSLAAQEAARTQRAKLRGFLRARPDTDDVVVLNNRGYNYRRPVN